MENKRIGIFGIIGVIILCCLIIKASNKRANKNSSPLEECVEYATDGWVTKYLTYQGIGCSDMISTSFKSKAVKYRVAFYKNGKPVVDSLVTDYDMKTGEKLEEKHLSHECPDVIIGRRIYYYGGLISSIANYVNGVREGPYTAYNKDGIITYKGNYSNDLLQGKVYRYFDNGKIKSIETFVDGKIYGYCEYYDENGNCTKRDNSIQSIKTPDAKKQSLQTSKRSNSKTPDDAYCEGYDNGYERGKNDAEEGRSHRYSYDDSSGYYNYYETKYKEGYEDGYNCGYDDGRHN